MKTKRVQVKRSNAGLGLFAGEDIKKSDFVIEYTGEWIQDEEANRRGGKYLFIYDEEWVVDGRGRKNSARYLNHSCRPNCETEIDEDARAIYIYAIKNIKAGDELTYDYGKDYWKRIIKPHDCRCGKCS